jgi:5-hydroxyisourate hydrolase
MITTHVLDVANGRPARGVSVVLDVEESNEWKTIDRGTTDENGRLLTLAQGRARAPGTYRLIFDLWGYHREHGLTQPFFPQATITFAVHDITQHYHVPLLISPFGYTTYRGS